MPRQTTSNTRSPVTPLIVEQMLYCGIHGITHNSPPNNWNGINSGFKKKKSWNGISQQKRIHKNFSDISYPLFPSAPAPGPRSLAPPAAPRQRSAREARRRNALGPPGASVCWQRPRCVQWPRNLVLGEKKKKWVTLDLMDLWPRWEWGVECLIKTWTRKAWQAPKACDNNLPLNA